MPPGVVAWSRRGPPVAPVTGREERPLAAVPAPVGVLGRPALGRLGLSFLRLSLLGLSFLGLSFLRLSILAG